MWAGLNAHSVGEERAREFLNAHEKDPNQPPAEREMDLWNNERAFEATRKLGNNFSKERLEAEALRALREGGLKVLR